MSTCVDGPTPPRDRPAHPLDCRFYPRTAEGEGLICECKRFPGLMCGRVCQYAKKRGNAAKPDIQGTLALDSCARSFYPPVGRGPRCQLANGAMVSNTGHKPAQWCQPGACPDFEAAS